MLQQWLEWHHLIFLLPLTAAVLMILLSGLSDLQLGHTDADVSGEAHVDAEADAGEVMNSGAEGELQPDAPHSEHEGGLQTLLTLFGVGHVPLSLLVQTVAILWGGVGLLMIQFASPVVAIPAAVLATLLGTRALAALFARLMGGTRSPARRSQLVGKTGHVVLEVTPQFGVVHVRDDGGTLHRLNARTERESLRPGQQIVIVGYDPRDHLYEVADPARYLESGGH